VTSHSYPIDDLPALALGLAWPTHKTNAKIRALADTAHSLNLAERPDQRQSHDRPPRAKSA
jgi:hypothetical protein